MAYLYLVASSFALTYLLTRTCRKLKEEPKEASLGSFLFREMREAVQPLEQQALLYLRRRYRP